MAPVTTYVFLDLETTGLPSQEYNKTRIKEISLIAVKREHLLATRNGSVPRVQNKLTLCINPQKMINPESTATTGLCNDLLEFETPFNLDAFNTINSFLGLLAKPVCLIAYNGLIFDYPIIRAQVDKLNVSFDDLLCTDAFHAFYYILEQRKSQILKSNVVSSDNSPLTVAKVQLTKQDVIEPLSTSSEIEAIINENFVAMQAVNETTPKRQTKFVPHTPKKCRRKLNLPRFPWLNGPKPKESYKLKNVYERVLKREAIEAHRAENDCILLMEVVVALAKEFVEWVDLNNCAFSDVNPMTPGIRIGLLVLTGVLWGCTNPFIRQGTKGLRDVRATTWLGQAWAEVTFLLGNWRYVVPWLVNQCGSLVYVRAVQAAPLSLAVPAANGLALAATALAGAALGTEEPLDRGSILGIVLIVAGTAICCIDKAE